MSKKTKSPPKKSEDAPMTKQPDFMLVPAVAEFIREAKKLRAFAVEAAVEFFEFLRRGEESRIHESAGCSFEKLITVTNLTTPARFREYVRAVEELGLEEVRELGIDPAVKVVSIPREAVSNVTGGSARAEVIREAKESVKRLETPLSQRYAAQIVERHYAPPKQAQGKTPLEKAQDAIKELRAEVSRLNRERSIVRSALGPARYDEIVNGSAGVAKAGRGRASKAEVAAQ